MVVVVVVVVGFLFWFVCSFFEGTDWDGNLVTCISRFCPF